MPTGGFVTGAAILGGTQLVGGLTSSKGAKEAGRAQERLGREQLAFAKEETAKMRADRERAYQIARTAALPSANELKAIDMLISRSESQLSSQLKMLDRAAEYLNSVEPSLKEAGNQLYSALKGEQTKMMEPIREERTRQKAQLEKQLASRFGPGFRSTSAGIAALNDFDNQTSTLYANLRFQEIGQLQQTVGTFSQIAGNEARGTAAAIGNAFTGSANTLAQAVGIEQNIKGREMNSVNPLVQMPTTSPMTGQAFQTLNQAVGTQYSGQIAMGQNIANLGSSIGQAYIQADTMKTIFGK